MNVKPVRRDPWSGHLIPYSAYEGWRPSPRRRVAWSRVAVLAISAAPWIVGALLWIGRHP